MAELLQQAIAAHQSGDIDGAERLYRALLVDQPEHADALSLLGVVRAIRGAHDEARVLVEKAIALDPGSFLFKFQYGNVLLNAQHLPEAAAAFRNAIALKPDLAEAHYNLANALRAMNDWHGAMKSYGDAITLREAYPEAYNNLALCFVHEGVFDKAMLAARRAVTLAPEYGEAWVTVCNVAEKVNDYILGLFAGKQAIRLQPANHYSWFGYGVILNRLDRYEEAIEAYKKALELKPDRADIWDNLGQTYQSLNRLDEAEATFRKTIEVAGQVIEGEGEREVDESEYGNRHWHMALMELLRGKYALGFARYRSRFREVGGLRRPDLSRPLWKGEDVQGKTILVCDEQGFGDTLMLCRYLPLLKERGATIIFSVHPALRPLFEGWSGVDVVIVHGEQVPAYDYYASVFDLPHRFGTTLETIPSAATPYLPLPTLTEATRLADNGQLKVGVVWGGNPLHKNDVRRSIPLDIFAGIFTVPGVRFYSFNRDKKLGDDVLLAKYPVTDLASRLNSFADSARFISQMDVVIACDTSTAHLAGGLGKAVWVLLPFAPDWRWLTDRDDNPWYATARLFRQAKVGDWADVVARVKAALEKSAAR